MGIVGFYEWIRTNYQPAIKSGIVKPILLNHIYFDLNYLLHLFYNEPTLNDKIKKLEDTILFVCKKYIPTNSVNLFCDGVAPLAKLLLQRERRLAQVRKSMSLDNLDNSSLNFTPGTKFIKTLDSKLINLKNKLENRLSIKVNIQTRECGEGEIKIKNLINKNLELNPDSSHMLVTNDGDVLLIVTATMIYKNIYILVKDDFISIKRIIDLHTEKYGCSQMPQMDFSFLNLFNGNDYFPKLRYITTNKLWLAYKNALYKYPQGLITEKLEVNKLFLIKILQNIVANIDYKILKKTKFNEYNDRYLDNYLQGLNWCFNMYLTGAYKDNCYMSYRYSPDPLQLIIYLHTNNDIILKNTTNNKLDIPDDLGCLLLLPEKALCLMDNNNYKDFINDHPELYEEERCTKCSEYNKQLSIMQKEYKKDDKELKKKITRMQKDYAYHNNAHSKIDINYIENIIKNFKEVILDEPMPCQHRLLIQ